MMSFEPNVLPAWCVNFGVILSDRVVARFFSGEEHLAKNMKREAEVYRISNVCALCIGGVEYSGYPFRCTKTTVKGRQDNGKG